MDFGQSLREILLAAPAVTDIVGTRIRPAPLRGPDEPSATIPAVTFQGIGATRPEHFTGRGQPARVRIQIDCWSSSRDGARTLFEAVRKTLDVKSSVRHDIQKMILIDGSDMDLPEPDVKLHRVSADFYIWHPESVEV